VKVGIVGGTGDFGQGLKTRLEARGHSVRCGSRRPRDEFVSNADACEHGDVVFLSIPAGGVEATARELAPHLGSTIAVSVATAVVFKDGKPMAETGPVSLAEMLALEAPGARVVSGFHTVSSKGLAETERSLHEDVLICGDDDLAKAEVMKLAHEVIAGRAIDAGPLYVSRWLETMTVVLLNVNKRYKANTGIAITDLP
jgi:8-hydroxy-5-deazaflavin:NADPH oxidoreductase